MKCPTTLITTKVINPARNFGHVQPSVCFCKAEWPQHCNILPTFVSLSCRKKRKFYLRTYERELNCCALCRQSLCSVSWNITRWSTVTSSTRSGQIWLAGWCRFRPICRFSSLPLSLSTILRATPFSRLLLFRRQVQVQLAYNIVIQRPVSLHPASARKYFSRVLHAVWPAIGITMSCVCPSLRLWVCALFMPIVL